MFRRLLLVPPPRGVLRLLAGAQCAPTRSYLTLKTMNADVRSVQYAVRGEIVTKAGEHSVALSRGEKRPFDRLTFCNIGNPHELGQQPITYFRQVSSLRCYSSLTCSREIGFFFYARTGAPRERNLGARFASSYSARILLCSLG